jgi:hypothetical protein|tara:strand:+ start:103 stop:402 length:300 start_codon:yes stop_codon:yes gene_type:complete
MTTLPTTIRRRFDHKASKQALKEKYQAKMIFAHKGGMFTAGPALITLLSNLDIDNPIIVDLYDTPISVNRLELKEQVISLWQEQLNAWQVELAELSAQR